MSRLHPESGRLPIAHDPDELLLDEANLAILANAGFTACCASRTKWRFGWSTNPNFGRAGMPAPAPMALRCWCSSRANGWRTCPGISPRPVFAIGWRWPSGCPDAALAVVRALPSRWLARLFERYSAQKPGADVGDSATADFVLLNVFRKIADALIETEADIASAVARTAFPALELPDPLVQRMAQLLEERQSFRG